jgi:hypothetical protein
MHRATIFSMTAAALSLFLSNDSALAQYVPKPRSSVGGYSGQELRQIYTQDIGQGFTAESQNFLANQQARSTVPYVGQSTTAYGTQRLGLGISSSRGEKPFSNVSSRPAVSPYLNLFREDFEGSGDFNYQTLVRPQLQQQQFNQRVQDESQALSRRVQQISASAAYNPQGSRSQYPTGHQTVFGYYGRFYPGMSARRQR